MSTSRAAKTPASLRPAVFRWTGNPPIRVGYYWYRGDLDENPSIVLVYQDEEDQRGHLSVRYGSRPSEVCWLQNRSGGLHQWSNRPIPLPAEPPIGEFTESDSPSSHRIEY